MFKRYFVTGLLLWIPIGITLWVLSLVVSDDGPEPGPAAGALESACLPRS